MSKNTNLSFLTDYITADITNGRIGINNASPTVAFDVSGATKISGALTLTSTISNGTYTYTLPSATGTLALTSAISGTTNYVPKFTASGTIGNSLIFDNGTAVGIGTSSPGSLFDVTNIVSTAYDSTNSLVSGQTMRIANTSTTSGISANLLFIATGGGGGNGIGTISGVNTGTGSLALTFATRDAGGSIAERMRITSTGNVGIGTTSPTGNANTILHINGTDSAELHLTRSNSGTSSTLGGYVNFDGSNNFNLQNRSSGTINFITGTTERMRITSDGNVGIGTSSPENRLHISNTGGVLTGITNVIARFNASTNTSGQGSGIALTSISSKETGVILGAEHTSGNNGDFVIKIYNGGADYPERMRIASGGGINLNNVVYGNTVNTSPRTLYIESGTGSLGGISSIRASKKNIENVSNVDWLYQLNPVTFNYRKKNEQGNYTEDIHDYVNYGLIAEDTAPIIDFIINYNEKEDGTKEISGIEYPRLIIPMLKAIQELSAENTSLINRIEVLENK